MNITAPGVVYCNSTIYYRYGEDINLLGIAKVQQEVPLNAAGIKLAKDYAAKSEVPDFTWKSREFLDGFDGKQGGLGILRTGEGKDQTMLVMKYGVHGLGHGHFDKLQFMHYDQQNEVIPDYGYCRWINIEPKFGGRYLPENNSLCKTDNRAQILLLWMEKHRIMATAKQLDKMHADRHFFEVSNPNIQVMSAKANDNYDGVEMQRTMLLINDEKLEWPLVVDLNRLISEN